MEVMWTLEFAAIQPADEECKCELIKVIESQLLIGRTWLGRQQLLEERDLAGEQVIGHLEGFVGNACTKHGDWSVCRCGCLAAWVVGMDASDK